MIGAFQSGVLSGGSGPASWDLTVQTTAASQDYTVNIYTGASPNITVDWGDGSARDVYTTTGEKTHVYAAAGTYTVKMWGSFASAGNIRLGGSNAENKHRLKATMPACFIPGLTSFRSTFNGCTGLTGSIPADLFKYNTQVTVNGFYATFYGCTGLTGSIPADLFRYNTLVTSYGFNATFYGCTGLTGSIPTDLFRYNTLVSSYGFVSAFSGCNKLSLTQYIFAPAGGESTRFLNQSPDFTNCFRVGTPTGAQGTAPELWNYNYGTGTPVKTNCFFGHSAATLTNYASIPAEWR